MTPARGPDRPLLLGVVADTHGNLGLRLISLLAGVDAVLHAGDVGAAAVLAGLRALAPVHAVRGNHDAALDGLGLPEYLDLEIGGLSLHLVHELAAARPPAGTDVVIFGHSHRRRPPRLPRRPDGRPPPDRGRRGRGRAPRRRPASLGSASPPWPEYSLRCLKVSVWVRNGSSSQGRQSIQREGHISKHCFPAGCR